MVTDLKRTYEAFFDLGVDLGGRMELFKALGHQLRAVFAHRVESQARPI